MNRHWLQAELYEFKMNPVFNLASNITGRLRIDGNGLLTD